MPAFQCQSSWIDSLHCIAMVSHRSVLGGQFTHKSESRYRDMAMKSPEGNSGLQVNRSGTVGVFDVGRCWAYRTTDDV
jgi:hypothetical protein